MLQTLNIPQLIDKNRRDLIRAKLRFFQRCGYYPSAKQLSVHLSSKRFRVIAGGARFGKSLMSGAEAAFGLTIPGHRAWFVGPAYELSEKEFVITMSLVSNYKMASGKRLIDLCRVSNTTRGSRKIETPWQSWVITKSCEKLSSLLGEELNYIYLCEGSQLPREAWTRYLRARISSRKGSIMAPSTPNEDGGLFSDMFSWGMSEDKKWTEWQSWQFRTLDNPTFDPQEWETAKTELPADVFAEQFEGKFVSRRGRVFPGFGDVHIFSELPRDIESWPVMRAIHHEKNAFNNPFTCLWVAIHPERRDFWIYKTYSKSGVLVDDALAEIEAESKGRKIIATVTDYYNPTLQANIKKRFSVVVNNEKKYSQKHAVVRKVQALQTALKIDKGGCVGVHVHTGCQSLISELTKAKWAPAQKEENEMAEREMATTKYMAGPLALSYVVAFAWIAQGISIYEAQGLRRG